MAIVCRRHVGILNAYKLDTFDRPNEFGVGHVDGEGGRERGERELEPWMAAVDVLVCDKVNDGPNIYYYYTAVTCVLVFIVKDDVSICCVKLRIK